DRHRDVRALPARQLDDLLQHHLVDAEEVGVARARVVDHGLLDAGRGGERTGRQQQRIAGFGLGRLGRHAAIHGLAAYIRPVYIPYATYWFTIYDADTAPSLPSGCRIRLVLRRRPRLGVEPAQPVEPGDGAGAGLRRAPVRPARPQRGADGDRPAVARHH